MPRPNKANGILAPFRDKFGKVPDHKIAEESGLSLSTVGKYRRANGLPTYQGYKFKKGELPPGHKAAKKGKKKAAPKKAAPKQPAAKKAAPPKKAAPKKAAPKQKKFRKSKLDPYAHLIGKLPDREVAEMAGTTPDGVRMYRLRHGIPAVSRAQRGQPRKVEAPKAAKQAAKQATKKAPPKKAAAPEKPAVKAPAVGAQAYEVVVRAGSEDKTYVVVAGDIVSAAQQASAAGKGDVVGVRHLTEALVAS